MSKRQYTAADLQVGNSAQFDINHSVPPHTHHVYFGRPLTRAEQHLFVDVIARFLTLSLHDSRLNTPAAAVSLMPSAFAAGSTPTPPTKYSCQNLTRRPHRGWRTCLSGSR